MTELMVSSTANRTAVENHDDLYFLNPGELNFNYQKNIYNTYKYKNYYFRIIIVI